MNNLKSVKNANKLDLKKVVADMKILREVGQKI